MSPIKRSLAAVGVAPMLAISLAACGGDDGGAAPADASVEEFCNVGDEFNSAMDDISEDDYEGFVSTANDAADQLAEVGTPEDIPEDARAGFEAIVDAFSGLEADAFEDTMKEITDAAESGEAPDENTLMQDMMGLDEADMGNIEAFTEYNNEVC